MVDTFALVVFVAIVVYQVQLSFYITARSIEISPKVEHLNESIVRHFQCIKTVFGVGVVSESRLLNWIMATSCATSGYFKKAPNGG